MGSRALLFVVIVIGTWAGVGCDKSTESRTQAGGSATSTSGGSSNSASADNPDFASEDDLYRADARAEGNDEQKAVILAHRHKDEDPVRYINDTRQRRLHIKYYCGDEGTTTISQYVKKRQAEIAASKAENEAFKKQADEASARLEKQREDERAKDKARGELVDKQYAALEKLRAEYKKRIDALPFASDDAAAMQKEAADKVEALETQQKAELDKFNQSR